MRSFLIGSPSLSGRALSRLISLACSVAFILFGYEQGVMGGIITGPAFTQQFPSINTTTGNGNTQLQGFTVAIYNIGCWAGSLLTMVVGERLGRKKTIIVGATVLAIGTVIQCSSYSLAQLLVGRIITGTGNGIITSTIPVWHAELCKAESRGKFVTVELSTNVGGVAVAYWVDYGMGYVNSGAQWRFPIALQVFFALSTVSLVTFLPETPRWLLSHGMDAEAKDILTRLHVEENASAAERERLEIVAAIAQEREAQERLGGKGSISTIFTNGEQRFFYRTMLSVWAMIMQQLTGINLITYYAPYIFIKSVRFSQRLSALMSGFLSLFYWLSTLPPIFMIDRVGRRPLLLIGLIGMACSMFVLAGTTSVVSFAPGVVATVALFAYDFFFGIGWIPGPWLLASEYAPLTIRSQSAALATSATWIFTFLVAEITPVAIDNIRWKTYIIFGVFNVVFFPIVYYFYPETKGKTLEQIDLLFSGPKVLIDISQAELLEMQGKHIEMAVKARKVDVDEYDAEKMSTTHYIEGAKV
ncbi:sugar transporter STL1 [Sparassis latifolia]|uniref:Sugar transporter STL1 n=1 Tax=Sparassis crispa TaxID=139825 RepID=A0A401GMA6_9APHY|nr:Sugar transporter STL1 [Sparassis crispa]GBE83371.1 Sugar transporter STL1 [Sparassis crispa]